jgi:hypothetical protein
MFNEGSRDPMYGHETERNTSITQGLDAIVNFLANFWV